MALIYDEGLESNSRCDKNTEQKVKGCDESPAFLHHRLPKRPFLTFCHPFLYKFNSYPNRSWTLSP